MTTQIAETLTRVNPKTNKLEGNLAESWTLSSDGRTWDFKLRPNVPFYPLSGGWGTLTAEDVKFSYEMSIRPESTSGRASTFRRAVDNSMDNFEIVGPLEFKLHTTMPVVNLDWLSSDQARNWLIYSKKYFASDAQRAVQHPIGTGAFEFVSSTLGVDVRLKAVENHWRQTSIFKNVTLKIIKDDAAMFAQVQSGAVDLAPIPPALNKEAQNAGLRILAIPEAGNIQINFGGNFPGIGVDYFKTEDPKKYDRNAPWIQADTPAKGLAIRQAMQLAIDSKTLLEKVLLGQGTLTYAPHFQWPSNPTLLDPRWTLPEFNLQKAKQKLAEGGYPDGFGVIVPLFDQSGRPGMVDLGEGVAGMWETLGLKVKRMPMDFVTFRPLFVNRATVGMAYVWSASYYPDDSGDAFAQYSSFGGAPAYWHPATTAAHQRALIEPNADVRRSITKSVLNTLVQETTAIPMFTYNLLYAAGPKVGGWAPIPAQAALNNLEYVTPQN